jgi:hypothetical protein
VVLDVTDWCAKSAVKSSLRSFKPEKLQTIALDAVQFF